MTSVDSKILRFLYRFESCFAGYVSDVCMEKYMENSFINVLTLIVSKLGLLKHLSPYIY